MDTVKAADERRIVLLGKTGYGKSSSANTTFGEQAFTVGHGPNSQTTECERKDKNIYGINLAIVDPPGFFDTDRPERELRLEVARCITKSSPGVHAFLIVLQVGRYTRHEEEVVQKITELFGEEAFKYAVVLFTRGNDLPVGQTIDDFVGENVKLRTLVQKCGGRCFVMDNTNWNQEHSYRSNKVQVEKLLNTIEQMVAQNGGRCYTNEMLQAVEEAIQQEEMVISQESGERFTGAEIRQRAEEVVAWKIKAAGIATGALLGALLGIPVVVVTATKLLTCLLKVLKKRDKSEVGAIAAGSSQTLGGGVTLLKEKSSKIITEIGEAASGTAGVEAAGTPVKAVGITGAEAARTAAEAVGITGAEAVGTAAEAVGITGAEAVGTAAEAVGITGAEAVGTAAEAVGITGAEAARTAAEAVGITGAEAVGTAAEAVGKTGAEAVGTAAEAVGIIGADAVEMMVGAGVAGAGVTGAGVMGAKAGGAASTTGPEAGGMSIGKKCAAVAAGVFVVATGAILGANEGLKASRNAKSPGEAAEKAIEAVIEGAKNIVGITTKEAKKE